MYLGIFSSHPIQYQAPWFRALAKEVELEVFFAHQPDAVQQGDGFDKSFNWDVDLQSGYRHRFLKNTAKQPGTKRFGGCDTPEIREMIFGKLKLEAGSWKLEDGKSAPSPISDLSSPKPFDAFIVSGWHLKSYWQAVRACRRARIPVLVRGDSQLLTPRSRLKSWIKKIGYRVMLRQFDGFLAVGQRNREYLAHYGVPPDKIFFAPHFVDNEWFASRAAVVRDRRSDIRQGWGIPEDAFCALFCGKFIPKKRPMDLLEAACLLSSPLSALRSPLSRIPNLHLLFVGSGELGAQLRANCHVVFDAENTSRSASDGERVGARCASQPSSISNHPSPACALPPASFAGFLNQSELPAAYVAADVLVLPSDGGETWGLVVNEAMACGTPAIVSHAAGCAPDLIDNGKTGFTFASGDCRELAQRLTQMAEMQRSDFDFLPALAVKAGNYSLSAAVRGTLQALKALSAK